MTIVEPSGLGRVRLDLFPPAQPKTTTARIADKWRHGRLAMGAGVICLGAFLGGLARWPFEIDGSLWLTVIAVLLGAALLLVGHLQQKVARRRGTVGIAVSGLDPHGSAEGRDLVEQAEAYSRRTCDNTFTVAAQLTGDIGADFPIMQQLVRRASDAIRLANRLRPEAARLNLLPIMRLHVAFWFGAQLGRSPICPIGVYAPRGSGDGDRYFLATVLSRPGVARYSPRPLSMPLTVSEPERIKDGDDTCAALAVDVLGLGDDFLAPVREECRNAGMGWLIYMRSEAAGLPPNTETWTAVVDQIEHEWRKRLPAEARMGQYAVFLDTTAAIAVALGAKLASTQPWRWTAFTLDRTGRSQVYEQFPPDVV